MKGRETAQDIVDDVCFHFQAWRDAVHLGNQSSALSTKKPTRRAPPENIYRINCDGAFIPGSNKPGWGFVIRKYQGMVIAAGAGSANFLLSVQQAEETACFKGLEQAAVSCYFGD